MSRFARTFRRVLPPRRFFWFGVLFIFGLFLLDRFVIGYPLLRCIGLEVNLVVVLLDLRFKFLP